MCFRQIHFAFAYSFPSLIGVVNSVWKSLTFVGCSSDSFESGFALGSGGFAFGTTSFDSPGVCTTVSSCFCSIFSFSTFPLSSSSNGLSLGRLVNLSRSISVRIRSSRSAWCGPIIFHMSECSYFPATMLSSSRFSASSSSSSYLRPRCVRVSKPTQIHKPSGTPVSTPSRSHAPKVICVLGIRISNPSTGC